MSIDKQKKVIEAIENYILSNSQNQLANYSGVNHRYIKSIREQNWEDVPDKYINILYEKLIGTNLSVHFENFNFKKVQTACMWALLKKRRIILDSKESGAGKTYGLEYFANHNDNALYIKATSLMKGKDLILSLLEALKIKVDGKPTNVHKLKLITDKLIQSNYVIILDEFESCSPDMYRVLKDIEDATYRKCGFVLSGFGIIQEIEQAAKKKKKLMPQIWRRFKTNKIVLKAYSTSNTMKICEDFKISDKGIINHLKANVEDWSSLNEWISDIKELLIDKNLEVNVQNFNEAFN